MADKGRRGASRVGKRGKPARTGKALPRTPSRTPPRTPPRTPLAPPTALGAPQPAPPDGPRTRRTRRASAQPPAEGGLVYVLSRAGLRQIDALCVERYGLPTIALMENAAAQVAAVAERMLLERPGPVLVVCGRGNNGGDGLAAARHLHNAGHATAVLLAAEPARFGGDAAAQLSVVQRMGLRVGVTNPADPRAAFGALWRDLPDPVLVIDALLGTGAEGPIDPQGPAAHLIGAINEARRLGARVLAVDLPSGMDADTGRGLGPANAPLVSADATVSMVGWKQGFLSAGAAAALGEVMIADIGCPRELVRRIGRPLTGVELRPRRAAGPHGAPDTPSDPEPSGLDGAN
ncbi:MAG: NAD(P)H-hydrate epimerase [Isosphaera sp.]|nr:NAD(P)H-hydrate epimerase [Isosphaera sp.]